LKAAFLTDDSTQPTAADFQALNGTAGSLVIELPLRRVAYALPDWHELEALSTVARREGVWIHMDGARLWECTHGTPSPSEGIDVRKSKPSTTAVRGPTRIRIWPRLGCRATWL
jgi:hypothetical protein